MLFKQLFRRKRNTITLNLSYSESLLMLNALTILQLDNKTSEIDRLMSDSIKQRIFNGCKEVTNGQKEL